MPKLVNKVVCAELPNLLWDLISELTAIMTSQISHRLYSLVNNPKAPYIVYKIPATLLICQKRFLKAFTETTIIRKDRYPEYYYQDNSQTFIVYKPGFLDQEVVCNNCQVVPYNLYLLQKFCSHINIKVYASIQAIKYIYKYIYKGIDYITIAISGIDNEITCYIQAQYIGLIEAFQHLFKYVIHLEFPPIQHLAIHLPRQHIVCFIDNLPPEQVAVKATSARSTLIAFFEYNAT